MRIALLFLFFSVAYIYAGGPCDSNADCTPPEYCFDSTASGCGAGNSNSCENPADICGAYSDSSECITPTAGGYCPGNNNTGRCVWNGSACVGVAGIPEMPSDLIRVGLVATILATLVIAKSAQKKGKAGQLDRTY